MSTYKFGAEGETGLAEGTFGFLQNFNKNGSFTEDTVKDASGNTALQDVVDPVTEIDCEYIFDSDTTAPTKGDIIDVGGKGYRVMSDNKATDNGSRHSLKLQLKKYDTNNIPAVPA